MAEDVVPPATTEVALGAESPRRRGRGKAAAFAVGALAVIGAGTFAALAAGSDGNTPEDPVRALFEAAEKGDVLGVLEQLDPGERDALRGPVSDLVGELNRLDILEDADLGKVTGLELEIDDLELSSEEVSDDVARITIDGGTGKYRFDAAELPLGGFVRDLIGDSLDDATESGSDSLASEGADDFVATVKRDGTWYVSLGYSIAEAARDSAGVSFDELGEGVAARGADSPEEAVEQMVTAATELDVRRLIELLPPGEMGALQRYAGLFIDDAESAASEAAGAFDVELTTFELDADTSGSRSLVTIEKLEGAVGFEGGSFAFQDGCFTIELPGEAPQEQCVGGDPMEMFGGMSGLGALGMDSSQLPEPPQLSFADKQPKIGIVTTQVDGTWYVSPTRTLIDDLVETLRIFEPQDLVEIRDYVTELMSSMESAFMGGMSDLEMEFEDEFDEDEFDKFDSEFEAEMEPDDLEEFSEEPAPLN